jgi:hypothetical protein
LPTIQRMEASEGNVRGMVEALQAEGVEMIGEYGRSDGGGRGVRLRQPGTPSGRAN